jgi:hypothetical protein
MSGRGLYTHDFLVFPKDVILIRMEQIELSKADSISIIKQFR